MKIPEAENRLWKRTWVCLKCGHKQRADGAKIRAKKVICRKCGCKDFRPKHKEKKAQG